MENSTDSSPLILALDTSAGRSSVTLFRGRVLVHGRDEVDGQQSRTLLPLIESVLAEAGVAYAQCDAVACAMGPGGFTSVRVGVATARAIAMTSRKPLIGIGSLEVMAFAAGRVGDVLCVINAHRQQFYVQRFRVNGTVEAQSQPLLVEEAGMKALAHGAKIVDSLLDADAVASLAHAEWTRGRREFMVEPLYIREPDAKLPA